MVVEDGVSLAGEPPLKNRANYPEVEKLVKCIEEVQQKGSSELVNGLILPEPPLPKLLFPDSSTQAKVCTSPPYPSLLSMRELGTYRCPVSWH